MFGARTFDQDWTNGHQRTAQTAEVEGIGHTERAEEGGMLRTAVQYEAPGRRPLGRSRKSWRKCVAEDLDALNIEADMAKDRQAWRTAIARPTPP